MVLDDLEVELPEDGPVVVDEADKVAGYLRQLPLTQGQAWGNLKVEEIVWLITRVDTVKVTG